MAGNSKIEWTHHTFNPWRGCTKVSAGCANCYAERDAKRFPMIRGEWGPNGKRVVAAEASWAQPVKWNKAAAAAGERHRVFCASLADVFEDWTGPMVGCKGEQLFTDGAGWYSPMNPPANMRPLTMVDVRRRLFKLIDATPNLDWLLLTKRPENILEFMPDYTVTGEVPSTLTGPNRNLSVTETGGVRPNVWLGTSVEDQAAADTRIPELLKVPAEVRFLSCEPLLGPVDLTKWFYAIDSGGFRCARLNQVHWVIVGGESGRGARPMHPDWVRMLRYQCNAAGVAFHFKQWGEWVEDSQDLKPRDTIPLEDGTFMALVGKKTAGRLLDGRTWDEFPQPLKGATA